MGSIFGKIISECGCYRVVLKWYERRICERVDILRKCSDLAHSVCESQSPEIPIQRMQIHLILSYKLLQIGMRRIELRIQMRLMDGMIEFES